ncbi:hypothetical protein PHYSODRAFT_300873 [Phytophthora sojae]|uniref:Uncharacterized protein n=1 Tax=Phytophthora sojae (strain P6497) TaxID=1094619 RepID=G4ZGW8_PHYSP|nr:hypothetical protein PHYSODRAFT_300873 [Phytophthora sojae]EGZ18034.1 hypothetical protein PHYSODRAFT_300873 [Phytophthora sojae]|eukprot:XP_009527092.1 hypothetical protein PHYSODRAFT_300873 [Phytophthora sojae]
MNLLWAVGILRQFYTRGGGSSNRRGVRLAGRGFADTPIRTSTSEPDLETGPKVHIQVADEDAHHGARQVAVPVVRVTSEVSRQSTSPVVSRDDPSKVARQGARQVTSKSDPKEARAESNISNAGRPFASDPYTCSAASKRSSSG